MSTKLGYKIRVSLLSLRADGEAILCVLRDCHAPCGSLAMTNTRKKSAPTLSRVLEEIGINS